jgi:large repetitive protein
MKRLNFLSLMSVLLLAGILFTIQTYGQGNRLIDAKSFLGKNYVQPIAQNDQGASRSTCLYAIDDGGMENAIGFTGASGNDVMWLNYFTAIEGCELINMIYVAWGDMANGGACRLILYEDPDNDGNPDDAVYLTEATTTVANANTSIFTGVSITPTTVSGGFFVAALCQNLPDYQFPAAMDQTTPQGNSWIIADFSAGGFDVNNLMTNDFPPTNIDLYFPGNWLLRAEGTNNVPLSNWALYIGLGLILVFTIVRFRKLN